MDEHRNDDVERPEGLPDERDRDEDSKGAGEILGIARSSGGGETIDRPRASEDEERRRDDTTRPHVGSRDVTEGTTGGTTPDTGGSGVYRRGSGATGTDIGS